MENKQIEKNKLKETIKIIKEILLKENEDLDKLYDIYRSDQEELWHIEEMMKVHIKNLEYAKDKPYFARIDFKYDGDEETKSIYIGKNGISKSDMDIIVTDWRSPISSVYYTSEKGYCKFEAPGGIISGMLNLKRQFEIENGELVDYFDVDLVSNDVLLQKYLNSNNDTRMKSIVSTIQKEQNEIIRKKINQNIIVQGVAGSGKTTVALHRIAYLVYNYMQSIKQSQYIVIGPNPVFLKYIKSVLPELDVSGVSQFTYEDFAMDYIGNFLIIDLSDKKVNKSINGKMNTNFDKFKCSMQYKEMIDLFLKAYFESIIKDDLKMEDFVLIDKDRIKQIFSKSDNMDSLKVKIDITIERMQKDILDRENELLSKYLEYSAIKFRNAKDDAEKNELRKKSSKDREAIKTGCRNILKKYFSKIKYDSISLYKIFLNCLNEYNIYEYENINDLVKSTLTNLKKSIVEFEDLAAIIYIQKNINPNKKYMNIKQVVIDEAQDLGKFNFYVLKETMPNATFSIFGDLAQSIYDYRSINNWDEVNDTMFNNNGDIIQFRKSYRTTAEIMSAADDVAEHIGLKKSDLVVRHGNPVQYTNFDNQSDIPQHIYDKIMEYKTKGYKSIAVISKTDLLSNYINDDLAELGLYIPNVSFGDDVNDEKFSVCTISNQLAKGLEFDAVIINNACEDIYSSNNCLDMKLLYVAITRALHELDIVYSGELTSALNNSYINNKIK